MDLFGGGDPIEVEVYGIACEHCRRAVESVVRGFDAVRSVTVEEGRALVRLKGEVEPESLVEAIRSAGYDARLATGAGS